MLHFLVNKTPFIEKMSRHKTLHDLSHDAVLRFDGRDCSRELSICIQFMYKWIVVAPNSNVHAYVLKKKD